MSFDTISLAADFSAMQDDLPQTIIFNGTPYTSLVHDLEQNEDKLDLAGIEEQYAFEAVILQSDFSTKPTINDLVTYSGKEYRVQRIRDSADGVTRSLFCGEVTG